jgi:hypothetical protein
MALSEETLLRNIDDLLTKIAVEIRPCKACNTKMYMVQVKGRRIPYTAEAVDHFTDCPNAQRFARGGKRGSLRG